jgi:hypothetical protein
MSSNRKEQLGQNSPNGGEQSDAFCKTIVAALAAMLALTLCQYIRRLLQG